jgi:spore coat polysaccharide biosynthesis predicted glycosyltransferase SpsG
MALARELRRRYQVDIAFMMKDYVDGIKVVQGNGFNVQSMKREVSSNHELDLLEQSGADLIVFDLIDIAEKDIGRLSNKGIRTVVIDDTGNKRIEADMVVNGSIVEVFHKYLKTNKSTKYYLGPKYCILGEEFDNQPLREAKAKVKSILVSMGGSDPTMLTVTVVKALANYPAPALEINVILGPAFKGEENIKEVINNSNNNFVIYKNVPSMAQMMLKSDIGITAGGMMAYELAATGTPGIIIPSNENERFAAHVFQRKGTALSLENFDTDLGDQLIMALELLMVNTEQRTKMAQRGQQIVDGQGRARVVEVLGKIFKLQDQKLTGVK